MLFYSGDDGQAKAEVAALIDRLGFFGIDLGSLAVGGRFVQFLAGRSPRSTSSSSTEHRTGHAKETSHVGHNIENLRSGGA